MTTLKEALRLIDLTDKNKIISIKMTSRKYDWESEVLSVQQLKNKYDLQHTYVNKIYHQTMSDGRFLFWEFEIFR